MNGLVELLGSNEGPLEDWDVFCSSCQMANVKYVGKFLLTRVEVLPSRLDSGREGQELRMYTCKGVIIVRTMAF